MSEAGIDWGKIKADWKQLDFSESRVERIITCGHSNGDTDLKGIVLEKSTIQDITSSLDSIECWSLFVDFQRKLDEIFQYREKDKEAIPCITEALEHGQKLTALIHGILDRKPSPPASVKSFLSFLGTIITPIYGALQLNSLFGGDDYNFMWLKNQLADLRGNLIKRGIVF